MARHRAPRQSDAEKRERAWSQAQYEYGQARRHLTALAAVAGEDGYATSAMIGSYIFHNPPSAWSDFVTEKMIQRGTPSDMTRCRKNGHVVSEKRGGLTWHKLTEKGKLVVAESWYAYERRLMDSVAASRERRLEDDLRAAQERRRGAGAGFPFAPADEGPIVNPGRPHSGRIVHGDDTEEMTMDEYVMESVGTLSEADLEDVNFKVGERVRVDSEHEIYPDEEGIVRGFGKGKGFYGGEIVYDVLIDGTETPERFTQDELDAV